MNMYSCLRFYDLSFLSCVSMRTKVVNKTLTHMSETYILGKKTLYCRKAVDRVFVLISLLSLLTYIYMYTHVL